MRNDKNCFTCLAADNIFTHDFLFASFSLSCKYPPKPYALPPSTMSSTEALLETYNLRAQDIRRELEPLIEFSRVSRSSAGSYIQAHICISGTPN